MARWVPGGWGYDFPPLTYQAGNIRLLQVDISGKGEHRLQSNISLRMGRPSYVALSYPWGKIDTTNKNALQIGARVFYISPNLDQAIKDIQTFWNTTYPERKELLLWIDQICIDQNDPKEKSHQVQFMGEIYRGAEQVLVWLPTARKIYTGGLSWKDWSKWELQCLQSPNLVERMRSVMPSTSSATKRSIKSQGLTADGLTAWSNMEAICASPWWTRCWVYQEFMFSNSTMFLFGETLYAPWVALLPLVEAYDSALPAHMKYADQSISHWRGKANKSDGRSWKRRSEYYWDNEVLGNYCCCLGYEVFLGLVLALILCLVFWKATHVPYWYGFFPVIIIVGVTLAVCPIDNLWRWATKRSNRSTKDTMTRLETIEQHIGLVREGKPSASMAVSILRSKAARVKNSDASERLSTLLLHASKCSSTDSRDKVYSTLGLAHPGYQITINYESNNTVNTTLTQAAMAVIQREQSLNIVSLGYIARGASAETDYLPTWVPKWAAGVDIEAEHSRTLKNIGMQPSESAEPAQYQASRDKAPVVSFHPGAKRKPNQVLKARGIRVDTIERLITEDGVESWRRCRGQKGNEITTTNAAAKGDEVWILFGLNIPITLSASSGAKHYRAVLGPAMIWDQGMPSPILQGSLIGLLDLGTVSAEDVMIA